MDDIFRTNILASIRTRASDPVRWQLRVIERRRRRAASGAPSASR